MRMNLSVKVLLEKRTPTWLTVITIFMAAWGVGNGYVANTRANQANETSQKSFKINEEIYKARELPRLVVSPLNVRFYTPQNPEVPGQQKIDISAVFENLSDVPAREVTLNFETEDWYQHQTSLFQIYREKESPIPHIFSLPKGQKLIGSSPFPVGRF